jgi:hypothetical protein
MTAATSELTRLWQAEQRLLEGKERIDQQRATIARLERQGRPTAEAWALLDVLIESQRLYREQHRIILRGFLK